jgi:hypothetical protein
MQNSYDFIIVESFIPQNSSGHHGLVHIRPLPLQDPYHESMFVECSKELSLNYPVGTRFRIKGKITSKAGGAPFVYSYYRWPYEVLK